MQIKIPDAEMRRIIKEQRVDRQWWDHLPSMPDDAAVVRAVECGAVVRVSDGLHYKISARTNPQYRVLTPETLKLLEVVSVRWWERIAQVGRGHLFLVVSSFTRPTLFQQQLAAEGRPALPHSSHEKGLAFDFAMDWFRANEPIAAETLKRVLGEEQRRGALNAIDEPTMGVFHVCVSPIFVAVCRLAA